jgi:alkaline phosphatase D
LPIAFPSSVMNMQNADFSSGPIRGAMLVALFVALAVVNPAQARLTLMRGYADYTSALLWIQTDAPSAIEVVWRTEGETQDCRANFESHADDGNVALARITGLMPGKTVTYVVTGDGDRREGIRRAQPHWMKAVDAPEIALAFGSCFFLADPDPQCGGQSYGGGYECSTRSPRKNRT